jgi:predicted PurR-regulated permease PerM
MENLNPTPWLQLGLGGGALFLVAFIILVWYLFVKSSSKQTDKLFNKIDNLVDAIYSYNKSIDKITITTASEHKSMQADSKRIYDIVVNIQADVKTLLAKEGG